MPTPPPRGRHQGPSPLSNDSPIHPLTGKSPALDCDTYGGGAARRNAEPVDAQWVASPTTLELSKKNRRRFEKTTHRWHALNEG